MNGLEKEREPRDTILRTIDVNTCVVTKGPLASVCPIRKEGGKKKGRKSGAILRSRDQTMTSCSPAVEPMKLIESIKSA